MCVCVYIYTRMQRFSATRVHIGYLDRKIFSIFPRGVVHSICKRVSCISPGLRLLPTAAPVPATAKGMGEGVARRRVHHDGWTTRVEKIVRTGRAGYGTKFTVQRECTRHGSRVAAKLSRFCCHSPPLFYFPLSRSTADLPAFVSPPFCHLWKNKKKNAWNSLRRSGLIGTSLISRLWGPLPLLLPSSWNLAWLMYMGFLLTSSPV